MHQYFLWAEEGLMNQPENLRNFIALLVIPFFLNQAVVAGPFEQGMTSLEKGDFAEAYCIWRPLAMRGHAEAAYHLGWLYANGNGLKVDVSQAVEWWTQAASQGHTDAQFALGMTYTAGEGIQADPVKALEWYLQAARGGHQDAREIIRRMLLEGADEVQQRLPELVTEKWLGQPIRVNVDKAILRSGPGTAFDKIEILAKDSILTAVGERDQWYRIIRLENGVQFGWIAGWLTEPVE